MEKILIPTSKWQILNNCRTGKKEQMEILKGINVSKKYIEATDGRIAVRIDRTEISTVNEGTFNIISSRKHNAVFTEIIIEPSEGQYPNTDSVFPGSYKQDDEFQLCLMPDKDSSASMAAAVIKLYERTKNCYSTVLLAKIQSIGETWRAWSMGQDKTVYLRDTTGTIQVLIMPFKKD